MTDLPDVTRSNAQFEKDRRHLLHPFAAYPDFLETGSRFFESAQGVHVKGSDGRDYLDGIGGLWCVNIGYGRQEMADAMAQQALQLPYYNTFGDMSSAPAADLAEKVAELAPGDLNHVFFTTGGSMSVDTAVRLAHFYFQAQGRPSKSKIIARENGYHGSTYLTASITGIKRNHKGFHTLNSGPDPLVHYVSCPNLYRPIDGLEEGPFCDALMAELESTIAEIGAENIACFIAEPIIGAGGVIVAPEGYHKRALEICRAHDILYISDEVVTAFGRLGHIFASEPKFEIVPDIIICAKGISSGYIPLGATIFSDRIHEGLSQPKSGSGVLSHGFTYSGHPVACAVGLKNIEIMEREDICAHAAKVGATFQARLASLSDLKLVGDVRGEGLMAGVELVQDKASKTPFDPAVAITKRVAKAAYQRGLVVRAAGDVMVMSPPLIISEEQVEELVETLKASLISVAEGMS